MLTFEELCRQADAWNVGDKARASVAILLDAQGTYHLGSRQEAACGTFAPRGSGFAPFAEVCKRCQKRVLTGRLPVQQADWGNLALIVTATQAVKGTRVLLKRSAESASWTGKSGVSQQMMDARGLRNLIKVHAPRYWPELIRHIQLEVASLEEEATTILHEHADQILKALLGEDHLQVGGADILVVWEESQTHPTEHFVERDSLLADVVGSLLHQDSPGAPYWCALPERVAEHFGDVDSVLYQSALLPAGWTREQAQTIVDIHDPFGTGPLKHLANAVKAAGDILAR